MPNQGRAMALEAGSAAHEVFAAFRLFRLRYDQREIALSNLHGVRLYGEQRFASMLAKVDPSQDKRQNACAFALEALYTGAFYDDPGEKRKTLSTIEEACIAYYDRYDNPGVVWIDDPSNPKSDVGIELPFDLVVDVVVTDDLDGATISNNEGSTRPTRTLQYGFIGKIDGISVHLDSNGDEHVIPDEDKTASRLNDAWVMSFAVSHQITGYCLAVQTITGEPITHAYLHGVCIPLPKAYDFGGVANEKLTRTHHHFKQWIEWFVHSAEVYRTYMGNPVEAPKYSHSCNRYFRPCSFIPFCDSTIEEKREIVNDMVDDEWNPLHGTTAVDDGTPNE